MKSISNKQLIIIAVFCFVLLSGALAWFLIAQNAKKTVMPKPVPVATTTIEAPTEEKSPDREVIGLSVENRNIEAFTFGKGAARLVFVGGIHGGYEWNSTLLAYELIDHLDQNQKSIPENLKITVIPSLNPDGVFKVVGKEGRFTAVEVPAGMNTDGRLNARGVDLNRNFACNWKAEAVWQSKPVSAGAAAFSEPESAAFKKFVLENKPAAVIFYHSQSNAIYGSQCGGDMLTGTQAIMNAYSKASGYKTVATFDGYAVTGDVTDWLSTIGIPAMTVELATHKTTEWEKNLSGIKALFEYYGKK